MVDRERVRAEVERLARQYPLLRRILDDAAACAGPDRPGCRCRWYGVDPWGAFVVTVRVPCHWGEDEARLYALLLVSAASGDLTPVENYLLELKAMSERESRRSSYPPARGRPKRESKR